MKDYARDNDATIFLTMHNMTEAKRVIDRVVLLNKGEIVFIGKAEALKIKAFECDVIEISLEESSS